MDNVANLGKRRQPIAVAEASPLFFLTTNQSRGHRASAIGESVVATGLEGYAFARVAAILANPRLGGCARVSVTKTRVPRDTKTFQPPVDARKSFGRYSNVH